MHSLVKLELVDVTDALLGRKDALRACDLIADKLGKEAGQLDINGSIRSSELRKKLYEKFGANLALYTMQALWREASSNGEHPSARRSPSSSRPRIRLRRGGSSRTRTG